MENCFSPEAGEPVRPAHLVPMQRPNDVGAILKHIESETLIMRLWNKPTLYRQTHLSS
jgi:hypothetical protein